MQKIIDQITDHLAGLITSEKPVYTPKELLKAKIPSFIVERIRLSLEDKVREEIGKGTSLWFDGDSKLVQDAWSDYMQVAIGTSHIPKDELYGILSSVVSDIIKVFIEPRKNMADYVFREDDELTYDEIDERCARLTIYKHFGMAIPLYMKKRDLETLTRERCNQLIHNLDAKLVASYSPNDWAKKLEQLFVLFGGEVEPKLLAMFFEDKGLTAIAKRFALKRKLITKSDFIFIISSKEGDTKKSKPLSDVEEQAKEEQKEQSLIESFFGDYAEGDESLAGQFAEGGLTDNDMAELLEEIASDGVVEVHEHDQVASLNELFQGEEAKESSVSETTEEIAESIKQQREEDPEEIKEFRENLISILDQAKDSFSSVTGEEGEPVVEEPDYADVFEEDSDPVAETSPEETVEDTDADGKPMWAKFLNAEHMETVMGSSEGEEEESAPEPTAVSEEEAEPKSEVQDFSDVFEEDASVPEPSNPIVQEMDELLSDRKVEFLSTIFQNSEDQYQSALHSLSKFTVWQDASAFIKQEIFTKNDVDLFSGATVDFTDRMHRYFNER